MQTRKFIVTYSEETWHGAFLYEDENPREIYFRLLALKDRILKK